MRCHDFVCLLALLPVVCAAQGLPASREIVQYSPEQAETMVRETIEQRFPPVLVDRVAVLVINRPEVVIPALTGYIRTQYGLAMSDRSDFGVDTASRLIAYAGHTLSVLAIEELIALDRDRFTPLVKAALDSASSWRNPYTVAYDAHELGSEAVRAEVERWVNSRINSWVSRERWAEALQLRYPAGVSEAVLDNDPLIKVIQPESAPVTRRAILDEVRQRRERQRR
jgi:hypothetical protein